MFHTYASRSIRNTFKKIPALAFCMVISAGAAAGIFDDIKKAGESIGKGMVKAGEAVADTGKDAVNAVEDVGTTVGQGVVDTGQTVGEGIVDTGETIVDTGETIGQGVVDVGEQAGQAVVSTAEIVGSEIVRTGENALNKAIELSEQVMIAMGTNSIVPRTNGLSADKVKRLRLQHTLDYGVPLNEATWIGTHNAYNNRDRKYPLPNQNADMIEQLDNGFRVLSYDLYADKITSGVPVRLCHKLCSGQEDSFEEALNRLAIWLSKNPRDVVMLIIEYDLSSGDANKAARVIQQSIGSYVYSPEMHSQNNGECQKLPVEKVSKGMMLSAGKQVILTSYQGCNNNGSWRNYVWDLNNKGFMADAALKESSLRDSQKLNIVAEDRSVYGADLFCADYLNVKAVRDIAGLVGKLGIPGANSDDIQRAFNACKDKLELTASEIRWALEKGVAVVGLDYAVDIDRAEGSIWSWEMNQPDGGSSEDCAALAKNANRYRWHDVSCDQRAYVACRDENSKDWAVPATQGAYGQAQAICQAFGSSYHFSAPVNAKEQVEVSQLAGGDVLLINANDAAQEGVWQLNMKLAVMEQADTASEENGNSDVQQELDTVADQTESTDEEVEETSDSGDISEATSSTLSR